MGIQLGKVDKVPSVQDIFSDPDIFKFSLQVTEKLDPEFIDEESGVTVPSAMFGFAHVSKGIQLGKVDKVPSVQDIFSDPDIFKFSLQVTEKLDPEFIDEESGVTVPSAMFGFAHVSKGIQLGKVDKVPSVQDIFSDPDILKLSLQVTEKLDPEFIDEESGVTVPSAMFGFGHVSMGIQLGKVDKVPSVQDIFSDPDILKCSLQVTEKLDPEFIDEESGVTVPSAMFGFAHVSMGIQLGKVDKVPSVQDIFSDPDILKFSLQVTVYSDPEFMVDVSGWSLPFSISGLLQSALQEGDSESCP